MSDFDTILRRASVVTAGGLQTLDTGIAGETFAAFAPDLAGSAVREIDATGKILFPGLVDAHVHFNEPGRTDWEGFATGSAALAAGGGTCFIDMPLNSSPPVLHSAAFEAKRRAGEARSRLDFALWGGLTPDSLPHLPALAKCGAAGFKAFMCPSGLDEFPAADENTLRSGMKLSAALGLPVAVHAESPSALAEHHRKHPPPSPGAMRDWLASRPVAAELAAIETAIACARDTGCALHIVHITSPAALALVTAAKREGIDITAETCPHYLLLDEEAAIRIGPAAKCAPPLRPRATLDALWHSLAAGEIDTIGSDHSPAPPELKQGDDLFTIWGGIAGCQHGFPLLIDRALQIFGEHTLPACPVPHPAERSSNSGAWQHLASLLASNPARRFRLSSRKGRLAPGLHADFCLLSPQTFTIEPSHLRTRHPISPYLGMPCPWHIESTWLRGSPVTPATRGHFLTPAP